MRAPCSHLWMDVCWLIGILVAIVLESKVVNGQEHQHLAVACAPNWIQNGKNCYRLYTSPKAWIDAFKACQSVGSILMDIESASEQTFLQNFVNGTYVWIGASDSVTEGRWLWYSSAQPWGFTNWDTNEPNSYGNEDCVALPSSGRWNDLSCDRTLAYVCKQSNVLSFCDATWGARNGHCYKQFLPPVIWSEALETCQNNSGYLVSVEDHTEMLYLKVFVTGHSWIGGFDTLREGTYAWAATTLLWKNTYWHGGQPNNHYNQDCLAIIRGTGTWNDVDCNFKYQSICQRNTFHLHEDPVVTMIVNGNTQESRFSCSFNSNFSDAEYIIQWYFNNKMVKEEMFTNERESFLEEGRFGNLLYDDQIKCSVTPCMPGNCSAMRGSSRDSEIFIAKVQVVGETHIITSERSGPIYINVTSTVPPRLFCDEILHDNGCNVTIFAELVKVRETKCPGSRIPVSQVVFGSVHNKPCTYPFTMDNWHMGILIPVKASIDGLKDRDQTRDIHLYITTPNKTKHFSTVKVTAVDADKIAVCSSINDPHMTTFDGKYYDNYLEGEFILYRHKSLPYEVRTFYRNCNGRAACNCAVAVRSGNDVILVDVCGPSKGKSSRNTPYTLKMYLNGDLTPGTEVIRKAGGKTYEIILPTGAKIIVMDGWVIRGRRFLNVKVVASAVDYNNTEGLCGTFDGDRSNDLTKRDGTVYVKGGKQPNEFSLSWRVPEDESLYRGYCVTTDGSYKVERYCDCMAGETAVCQEGMDLMSCVEIEKRRGVLDAQRGRKRVTLDLIRDAESPPTRCESIRLPEQFQHEPEYRQPDPQWPTPSNITEDIARKLCQDFMGAEESGKKCMNLPGLDLTPILQGCINDIQLTDGTDWAKESLDNLQQECTTIVEKDTEKWTVDAKTGDAIPPPDIVGSICPNSCTDNGKCTGGLCVCAEPWIGDDCSVNSTAPPELYQVGTGKPCDSICSNCSLVQLYGENFADTENLTCHYRFHNANLGSVSDVTTSKAEFFNSQTVTCLISTNGVYEIAVSNNGETTSVYKVYMSYNSYCDECNETGCSRRSDVCEIQGSCFISGFVNPSNATQVCDTTRSKCQWSALQVENIQRRSYVFQSISGQTLMTKEHSVTIGGTGTPTLITGLSGERAVVLDGNQYLSLGDLTGACFGDVEKSTLGITITFNVKFTANISNCYVFSNGGEEESNYGYFMWSGNDKLHASVSNSEYEWVVSTSSAKVGEFMHVEMSWSLQNGLKLNIDQNVTVSSKKCIPRPASNYTVLKDFVIGGSSKKDRKCQMAIGSFSFVCAFTDIINSTGFNIREPTTTHCTEASRLGSDAAVISLSVVSGASFSAVILLCLFIGCRRRRKKKRFVDSSTSTDFEDVNTSFKKSVLNPVFWHQGRAPAYRYYSVYQEPRWLVNRYDTYESRNFVPQMINGRRAYARGYYEEEISNSRINQPEYISQINHQTTRSDEDHIIHKNMKYSQSNRNVSASGVSEIKKYEAQYKVHDTQSNVTTDGNENSFVGNRSNETTVWVPVESDEPDIAVYQASNRQKLHDANSSSLRLQSENSTENGNLEFKNGGATTVNNGRIGKSEWSSSRIQTSDDLLAVRHSVVKQKVCPYCTTKDNVAQTVLVGYAARRDQKSVDSSSQTGFVHQPSIDTQSSAMHFKDDQMNMHAYSNEGYENTERSRKGMNQQGTRSNIGVSYGEEKKGDAMSEVRQTDVTNLTKDKMSGESFEIQEETLWLQNDSDDNQSEKAAAIWRGSTEIDNLMIKREVEPKKSKDKVYEIQTVWLPDERDQKGTVPYKQQDDGSLYLYHTEMKQNLRNPHMGGSALTMHDTKLSMESHLKQSEADSENSGKESYEKKPKWSPREEDKGGHLMQEQFSDGKQKDWIIFKGDNENKTRAVPLQSVKADDCLVYDKHGEVKLTKDQMLESVEITKKTMELEQKPVLSRHHQLEGKQQSLSYLRRSDLETPNMNYKYVGQPVLVSANGSKKNHVDGIERTFQNVSREFGDRVDKSGATEGLIEQDPTIQRNLYAKVESHWNEEGNGAIISTDKSSGFEKPGPINRQLQLNKSQMKHLSTGNAALMSATGCDATVHYGDDKSAKDYKPGALYRQVELETQKVNEACGKSGFVSPDDDEKMASFGDESVVFYKPGGIMYILRADGTREYLMEQDSRSQTTVKQKFESVQTGKSGGTSSSFRDESLEAEKSRGVYRQVHLEPSKIGNEANGKAAFVTTNPGVAKQSFVIESSTISKPRVLYRLRTDGTKEYLTEHQKNSDILESVQHEDYRGTSSGNSFSASGKSGRIYSYRSKRTTEEQFHSTEHQNL